MDILRALESLVPGPEFKGTMKNNTQAQYTALDWTDTRKKPTLAKLTTEDARLVALDSKMADDSTTRERIRKRDLERQKAEATAAGDTDAEKLLLDDIAAVTS